MMYKAKSRLGQTLISYENWEQNRLNSTLKASFEKKIFLSDYSSPDVEEKTLFSMYTPTTQVWFLQETFQDN